MKDVRALRLARWLFTAAGVYGVAVLLPLYFLEANIAVGTGVLAHPEYFYGFVALAAQGVFFMIAYDPLRFRPAMLFAVLEKLAFAVPVFALFGSGRVVGSVVPFGAIDFFWAIVFASLWLLTPRLPRTLGFDLPHRCNWMLLEGAQRLPSTLM